MGAIQDALLAEYDHEIATTRKLLERLPDDKLAWKPHEKSMSLGGLATHLGNIPNWGDTILNDASFDLASAPPNLDAEDFARRHSRACSTSPRKRTRAAMDKTDPEYLGRGRSSAADRRCSRCRASPRFARFVLYHLVHHRGQLSVYLRLNDMPVPPIYGPTADEG